MSLAMDKQVRESFLADLHVGVVSMNRQGLGPLSAPIWYSYEAGEVRFVIGDASRKAEYMTEDNRITLVAQTETPPYQYVSVEGPVIQRQPASLERDIRPVAIRYLGEQAGNQYADANGDAGQLLVVM